MKLPLFLLTLLPTLACAQFQPEVPDPGKRWATAAPVFPPIADIVARPAPDLPVYGVYCWSDEYVRYRQFIREVGWTSLRLGGPITDEAIRMTAEDGMEVMLTIGGRLKEGEGDEAFIARYVQSVEQHLERYGPGGTFFTENPAVPKHPVAAVEICNEPNFQYLDGKFANTEERLATEAHRQRLYTPLLKAAGERVKARWPGVKVIGFGAGGSSSGDVRFIKACHELQPGLSAAYDVLSTHPYVSGAPPESQVIEAWGRYTIGENFAKILGIMAADGAAAKPLWYTEQNWEVLPGPGARYPATTGGNAHRLPPDLQAAYVTRGYANSLRLGVERHHYMSLVDTDNCNSGFMNTDRSWRPSAHAIKRMIQVLPRPKLLGAVHDGADGQLFVYRIRADFPDPASPEVLMAWNVTGPREITLDWPRAEAEVLPMSGDGATVPAREGKLALRVGAFPVYVR